MGKIGIAILSTNRFQCLQRLIDSIEKFTPASMLKLLDIFVSDDSNEHAEFKKIDDYICKKNWIEFKHIGERVGVAKNSNCCLEYLRDRQYKLLLNNDVEILKEGWEQFYFDAMIKTKFHHFCFQQEGLWGAGTGKRPETRQVVNNIEIKTINDFPQGAILALDQKAFTTVGYFDSKLFKGYGKSHWDWSFRVSYSKIQPEGIHDVVGSNAFFKIHDEPCCTPQYVRVKDYQNNTEIFNEVKKQLNRIYIPYAKVSRMG